MDESESSFQRQPPHSIAAEMCLIASLMLFSGDPAERQLVMSQVREIVTKDSFFQVDHQIYFDVICARVDQGKQIDPVLMREDLIRQQLFEEVGGVRYLATILDSVPSAAHWKHYAEIVSEKSLWRSLIAVSDESLRAAYSPAKFSDSSREATERAICKLNQALTAGKISTLTSIGDASRDFLSRRSKGLTGRIYTGLRELDRQIGGLATKRVYIDAGRPGSGKSQLLKQVAKNVASGVSAVVDERGEPVGIQREDQPPMPVGIISIEEDKDKIATNLLSNYSGVANNKIAYGTASEEDWEQIDWAADQLSRLPIWIEDAAMTVSSVRSAATRMALEKKCRFIGVDYLQLIDPQRDGSLDDRITAISRALKFLGKELDVVMFVCAQLNRAGEQAAAKVKRSVKLRDGTRAKVSIPRSPQMADLRGSGSIEQDGDVILLLHRDDYYTYKQVAQDQFIPTRKLEVTVEKNKDGPNGIVPLFFSGKTQTISDWDQKPEDEEDGDSTHEDLKRAIERTSASLQEVDVKAEAEAAALFREK